MFEFSFDKDNTKLSKLIIFLQNICMFLLFPLSLLTNIGILKLKELWNTRNLLEKMAIIQEYLTTEISLTQMVKKYHIGWTTIPKWMRKFGIPMPNEAPVQIPMSEETKKPEKKDTVEALEARLQELQAELDREKLKNLALNTMIEVAEEELQIDIRKKPGAQQ